MRASGCIESLRMAKDCLSSSAANMEERGSVKIRLSMLRGAARLPEGLVCIVFKEKLSVNFHTCGTLAPAARNISCVYWWLVRFYHYMSHMCCLHVAWDLNSHKHIQDAHAAATSKSSLGTFFSLGCYLNYFDVLHCETGGAQLTKSLCTSF